MGNIEIIVVHQRGDAYIKSMNKIKEMLESGDWKIM